MKVQGHLQEKKPSYKLKEATTNLYIKSLPAILLNFINIESKMKGLQQPAPPLVTPMILTMSSMTPHGVQTCPKMASLRDIMDSWTLFDIHSLHRWSSIRYLVTMSNPFRKSTKQQNYMLVFCVIVLDVMLPFIETKIRLLVRDC